MNKITKTSLSRVGLLALVLVINVANAETEEQAEKEDNKAPIGCRDTGYQFELKTLHLLPGSSGDNQSMYFLFNESNRTINLYQMRSEESSRSTYLNHAIGSRQLAVLSTSEKQVKFICTTSEKKSSYGEVVDCGQMLRVCEYTNVRYGLNNRGNYWLVNSNSKNAAIREVVHYGIIPGQ